MRARPLVLLALPIAAAVHGQAARQDLPSVRRELLAADSIWSAHDTGNAPHGFIATLAQDAIVLVSGHRILRGQEAATAFLAAGFADSERRPRWRAVRGDVSRDGSFGYTYGYTAAGADRGAGPVRGKYLAAWRRDGGVWRVLAYARYDAPDVEPAPAPPGFETPTTTDGPAWPGDPAGACDAVLRADSAFASFASTNGIATAFATYAAPDAAILSGTPHFLYGPAAIRASFAGLPAGAALVWAPVDGATAPSGDLGFTVGEAKFSAPDPKTGRARVSYSKYLTIWKRQPDGEWKFVVDGGNARPAP